MEKLCKCGGDAFPPRPPKYSQQDNYADYRRKAKRKELEEKGWL